MKTKISPKIKIAAPWKDAAVSLFEKSLFIFSHITDGSIDEGVAYGSYTTRGHFQYVYLSKRHHLTDVDHTINPWLRAHLWFNYATVLPGFQRTVGIADSNHNWFYGPEFQLVFLDAHVLRSGHANWLADRIRATRVPDDSSPLSPHYSQKWSLTHLEYVFYDASIEPVPLPPPPSSGVHIFHDWGVAAYGGGHPTSDSGATFLAFKSGALNGEAVAEMVEHGVTKERYGGEEPVFRFAGGWWNFNAGHEHPDQNSFVFAPNGRLVVSDTLYAPKLSSLNSVLMFQPGGGGGGGACEQPWEGQVGECGKWLGYEVTPVPRGRIVSVTEARDMVHMVGEAAGAYRFVSCYN